MLRVSLFPPLVSVFPSLFSLSSTIFLVCIAESDVLKRFPAAWGGQKHHKTFPRAGANACRVTGQHVIRFSFTLFFTDTVSFLYFTKKKKKTSCAAAQRTETTVIKCWRPRRKHPEPTPTLTVSHYSEQPGWVTNRKSSAFHLKDQKWVLARVRRAQLMVSRGAELSCYGKHTSSVNNTGPAWVGVLHHGHTDLKMCCEECLCVSFHAAVGQWDN